ncbi:uncharacterized protein LOC143914510 isoform X2 [Arctopsyche grandis]
MMCRPSPAAILAPAVSGVPTTLQSDEHLLVFLFLVLLLLLLHLIIFYRTPHYLRLQEHHLVLLDNSLLVPVLLATYYCQHNIGMMLQL